MCDKENRITICSICEKFKIKHFNLLYKEFLNLNIDPMDIKQNELSLLLFKEIKRFNFEDLVLTTKADSSDKFLFMDKWFKFKTEEKIVLKDEFSEKIDLIIEDLNNIRKKYFNFSTKFQSNPQTTQLIKKYLKQGFTVEDFFIVHETTAKTYSEMEDEKLSTGFYFRPITIYNGKFPSRVENGKTLLEKKEIIKENFSEKDLEQIIDDLNKKRLVYFNLENSFNLENNRHLIEKHLKKGFTINDFLEVHTYIGELYKEHDNKKIAEGFYYRPSTIYDDKFPLRVENSRNKKINDVKEEEQVKEGIEDILKKLKEKSKR